MSSISRATTTTTTRNFVFSKLFLDWVTSEGIRPTNSFLDTHRGRRSRCWRAMGADVRVFQLDAQKSRRGFFPIYNRRLMSSLVSLARKSEREEDAFLKFCEPAKWPISDGLALPEPQASVFSTFERASERWRARHGGQKLELLRKGRGPEVKNFFKSC